jgi:hypothetical protein
VALALSEPFAAQLSPALWRDSDMMEKHSPAPLEMPDASCPHCHRKVAGQCLVCPHCERPIEDDPQEQPDTADPEGCRAYLALLGALLLSAFLMLGLVGALGGEPRPFLVFLAVVEVGVLLAVGRRLVRNQGDLGRNDVKPVVQGTFALFGCLFFAVVGLVVLAFVVNQLFHFLW